MTHLIIDRRTYALGLSLIIERCGNSSHLGSQIVHPAVDLPGGNSLLYMLPYIVKYRYIDLGTLFDSGDLIRILDQLPYRNHMPLLSDPFYFLIKCHVTLFVLSAAFAPAGIISSYLDLFYML